VSRFLIRGGTIVDGTGAPPVAGDLVVEGDRVVAMGEGAAATADRVIDANGLIVAPGFIDLHSHADLIVTLPPERQRVLQEGRLAQGITTEIVGNCGLGVFPASAESMIELRAIVAWMTPPDATEWPSPAWGDFASWSAHLESNGLWNNVGAMQPHGPLRMVSAGLSRPAPTPELLARMSRDLHAALEAGAFGLTTGLIYPPGIFTQPEEIETLARVVREVCGDAGFVASHIRGSSETLIPAVEELVGVGKTTRARVHHSHNEAVGRAHWGKIGKVLAIEEQARKSGISIAYDMFPYTAAATMMVAIYPPWALEGGVDRLLERLGDPAMRRSIGEAVEKTTPAWPPWTPDGWPHNLVKAVGWDLVTVGSVGSAANRRYEGMTLTELGRAMKKTPFDAISDLMIEENGVVSQLIHGISGDESHDEGMDALLSDRAGAVCTDANDFGKGRPHPAAFGAFPRVLARWVREKKLLTLQEAVRKMTGYPASLLSLRDRGVLRAGAFADIVLFDAKTVGSTATYAEPRRQADGIRCVLVNGRQVWPANAEVTTSPPGRFLRRGA